MSKRFLLQNTAIGAIIALVATVMAASPVVGQVGETVGGAASDDAAFAEPGEAVDIDVVANDDGMDDFDAAPTLLVVDQPDGGVFSTALDEDGIAVLLFSANVTFTGITKGKYRACWGNRCDNAEVTVYVGGEACSIAGTNGPDTLTGTSGDDVICGLSGADTIDGKGGNDLIFGGNGKDTLRGSGGADEIYGGRGDDTIFGGNGADKLFGRKGADTISGNGGADEIHGNRGADIISGGNGDDMLFGGRGQDAITGGDGDDVIRGRRGDDDLRGNANADQIFGGRGADSLRGNGGDDVLNGGNGTDSLNGGNGTDTCTRGETVTNCEDDPVEPGTDTDGDGIPDDEDPDDDNDGTPDDQDAFPLDPNETTDTDGDGVGDNADPDIDGDGVDNGDDAFPLDPTETTDTDGDGTGNNADTDDDDDTFADDVDAFPLDPLEWLDTDGDGVGNNADLDDDGDGIPDVDDDDPLTPIDPTDTDGDGIPDAIDPDIDNDGIPNELDDFPNDDSESSDTDGDGIGDNTDPDADNDGVLNEDDAFPFDDGETVDSDGGGLGDNADPDDDDDGVFDDVDVFPNDGTEWEDTDGDGTGNNADTNDDDDSALDVDDAFPLDPTETLDTDFDGIGNNADPDDDNDGVLDGDDAFPLDSLVSKDTDGDGIGDLLDDDNDNDGALDLADAFPNDPNETLDTDLDGVGNNADPDDDGDTFNDDVDAFPLDPNEWSDLDGNGVGDNADLVADLDGDGLPDGADPDIDGDLVDNVDDAFPLDPTEWADSDGDGIGDNEDTDDDDDGVPDDQDLLPNDPNTGTDSDGDGTPDTYDLDPNSADEPRFQVVTEEPSGAATTIVSDGLILEDEVVITEEPVAPENAISTVAASEIVDFTIDGPFTEFETARITIPIDQTLAQQPDPVEVWWFNEEYGLWVPDGTDLEVDPTNATVSVTVDHFSKFIAMRAGARPTIVKPDLIPNVCLDVGLDVVFVVDVSGSNEYDYIVDGQLVSASDKLPEFPGDSPTDRVLAVGEILDEFDSFDRAAVLSFADDQEIPDLELGSFSTGFPAVSAAVAQAVQTPRSGTDVLTALSEASDLFSLEPSNRSSVVILFSDGRGEEGQLTEAAVATAVGDDVVVHVVDLADGANPDLRNAAIATGGAYAAAYPGTGFDEVLARLNDTNDNSGIDSDGDTLTNCEELRGLPTTEAMGWSTGDGSELLHDPAHWPKSISTEVDSDGDLLWDSEEYRRVNLRSAPDLESIYSRVLDAGIDSVFLADGADAKNANLPIAQDGTVNSGFFYREPSGPVLIAKSNTLTDQRNEIVSALRTGSPLSDSEWLERVNLTIDLLALEDDVLGREPDFLSLDLLEDALSERWLDLNRQAFPAESYPQGSPWDVVEQADSTAEALIRSRLRRLLPIMKGSEVQLFDRNRDIVDEAAVLTYIDGLTLEMSQFDPESQASAWAAYFQERQSAVRSLLSRLERDADKLDSLVFEFEDLAGISTIGSETTLRGTSAGLAAAEYTQVTAAGERPLRLGARGAYRLLRYRSQNVLDDYDRLLASALRWEFSEEVDANGNFVTEAGPQRDRSFFVDAAPTDLEYKRLVLEAAAAFRLGDETYLADQQPIYPLFRPEQNDAINFLLAEFAEESVPRRGAVIETEGLVSKGLAAFERPSVLWRDFEPVAENEANIDAEALGRIWDDLSLASSGYMFDDNNILGSAWKETWGVDGVLNEPNINSQVDLTWEEYALRFQHIPELYTAVDLNEVNTDTFAENHPGMFTKADIIALAELRWTYAYFGNNADLIDTIKRDNDPDNERFISREDMQDFIELMRPTVSSASIARMEILVGAGFFDDKLNLQDLIAVFEALAITFVVVGGAMYLLGASSAVMSMVGFVAAVNDIALIGVNVAEGDIGAAVFDGIFILADGLIAGRALVDTLGRRLISATEASRAVVRTWNGSGAVLESQLRYSDEYFAPDDLSAAFADGFATRPEGTVSSQGLDTLLTVRGSREAFVSSLAANGADDTADLIPVITKAENDVVAELPAVERANYRDARDRVGSDEEGVAGTKWGLRGLDDIDLSAAAGRCLTPTNSFGGAMLVEMADGSMLPIADIQIGDEVLAYDFDTGSTVSRVVTATLPHEDWLLQAHLSDGSVMTVTEDHRFWSVTDSGWVELQDLDSTDQLLTPDGVMVTVDWLDWDAGADAPAWDLTVAEEHNFFVAADTTAEPVLVHNMSFPSEWCGLPIADGEQLSRLNAVSDSLSAIESQSLEGLIQILKPEEGLAIANAIDAAEVAGGRGEIVARRIVEFSSDSANAARLDASGQTGLVGEVFGGNVFTRTPSDWVAQSIRQRTLVTRLEDGTFISPRTALRYGPDEAERFDTVVDHVLDHTYAQPDREQLHGVFTTRDPLVTVDAAWLRRAEDVNPVVQTNGNTLYRVRFDDFVGELSGAPAASLSEAERRTRWVAVVVKTGDESQLVNSFPIVAP